MIYITFCFSLLFTFSVYVTAQDIAQDTATESEIATLAQRSRVVQSRSHYRWANQLATNNHEEEALLELNQALALQHDYKDALWLRARVNRQLANYPASLADYQALLYLSSEQSEARFERAQLLYRLERYEDALADFKILLQDDLGETTTVYFRGSNQSLAEGGNFVAESATTVQSGIQADIRNLMGLCYLELEEYEKATLHFELALSQDAQNPGLYSNLGLTAERQRDTLQAIHFYRQALLLHPNHPVALQNFSNLTRQANQLDIAESTFNELSNSEADSPYNFLHRGMLLHQQRKYQQAVSQYDKAIALLPQEADFYLQRGFSLDKLQRFDQAVRDYSQALRIDPRLEKAYVNRGNVYYKKHQLKEAVSDYQSALSLNSNNAKIYYNLGLVYHRLDQFSEACEYLDQALNMGYTPAESIIEKVCRDQ